jgi:hypothetical protein
MVGLGRVELPTYSLGNCRSIQLSYSPVPPESLTRIRRLSQSTNIACSPVNYRIALRAGFEPTTFGLWPDERTADEGCGGVKQINGIIRQGTVIQSFCALGCGGWI